MEPMTALMIIFGGTFGFLFFVYWMDKREDQRIRDYKLKMAALQNSKEASP